MSLSHQSVYSSGSSLDELDDYQDDDKYQVAAESSLSTTAVTAIAPYHQPLNTATTQSTTTFDPTPTPASVQPQAGKRNTTTTSTTTSTSSQHKRRKQNNRSSRRKAQQTQTQTQRTGSTHSHLDTDVYHSYSEGEPQYPDAYPPSMPVIAANTAREEDTDPQETHNLLIWLRDNHFDQTVCSQLHGYTMNDLLLLQKSDLKDLLGVREGIRLFTRLHADRLSHQLISTRSRAQSQPQSSPPLPRNVSRYGSCSVTGCHHVSVSVCSVPACNASLCTWHQTKSLLTGHVYCSHCDEQTLEGKVKHYYLTAADTAQTAANTATNTLIHTTEQLTGRKLTAFHEEKEAVAVSVYTRHNYDEQHNNSSNNNHVTMNHTIDLFDINPMSRLSSWLNSTARDDMDYTGREALTIDDECDYKEASWHDQHRSQECCIS